MTEIFAGLETFLYVVSSALFQPVIAALVLLIFWIAVSFGGLIREYIERKQGRLSALERYKKIVDSEVKSSGNSPEYHLDVKLERNLQEAEHALIKSLDRVRFIVRVGPAIGLMGTLIPMGIALSAMAQGDMPAMADRMVTAFTTTVAGLACGVAAYLMSMVKEKWVRADMREMEHLTELAFRNSKSIVQNLTEEVEDEISEEKAG